VSSGKEAKELYNRYADELEKDLKRMQAGKIKKSVKSHSSKLSLTGTEGSSVLESTKEH
jgi:hypothetical protein